MTASPERKKISVTVIALNEETEIGACLESVSWADEIVVVDSGSVDQTVAVARKYTDRVIHQDWLGFSAQKNYAVRCAAHDWIFSLDADERVPLPLQKEIAEILQSGSPLEGYYVPRKNYFLGRWIRYAGWYPDYTIRLFNRKSTTFSEREVHETARVDGTVGFLKTPLEHYTYRSLRAFHERMGRYAYLSARQMKKEERRFKAHSLLTHSVWTFFKMYFLQQGFREGIYGLMLSGLYSYYTFLKYAVFWELERSTEGDLE